MRFEIILSLFSLSAFAAPSASTDGPVLFFLCKSGGKAVEYVYSTRAKAADTCSNLKACKRKENGCTPEVMLKDFLCYDEFHKLVGSAKTAFDGWAKEACQQQVPYCKKHRCMLDSDFPPSPKLGDILAKKPKHPNREMKVKAGPKKH